MGGFSSSQLLEIAFYFKRWDLLPRSQSWKQTESHKQNAGGPEEEEASKMPAAPAPKEDAQPAPRKSQTMTRFSANEKEQMKTGNRTAYVAMPKNLTARRATKPSVSHLD
ncbi:hypothetical protein N7497_004058 [Penicillium chrysogenum]|nr:hypothetical protein N7497_004058 [Penicillium chrysogenum]